jgi:hypothetical protein
VTVKNATEGLNRDDPARRDQRVDVFHEAFGKGKSLPALSLL